MEKCGLRWTLFLILCSISLLFVSFPSFALDSIGQMVWVKGTVKAAQPDKEARVLVRRSAIYATDTITTNADSTGQIVFSDNSLLVLRVNTVLAIAKYKYNKPPVNKDNSFVADVAKGGLRTITGAIAKETPNNYQTNTPVATIGVSGTDYTFYYDPTTKKLDAMITKGVIQVKNAFGSQKLDATCRMNPENFCYRVATVDHNKPPKASNKIPDSLRVVKILVPATFDPNAKPGNTQDNSSSNNLTTGGGGTGGSSGSGKGSGGGGNIVSGFSINQPCP